MTPRTSFLLLIVVAALAALPAKAQLPFRVVIKDTNPAKPTITLTHSGGRFYGRELVLANGFGEQYLDSGRHIFTMRSGEVMMTPSSFEISVPEQAGDTFYISTKSTPGSSTLLIHSYFYDTATGKNTLSGDVEYKIVNVDDPMVLFEPDDFHDGLAVFNSITHGEYEVAPLYDTTQYLHTRTTFSVGPKFSTSLSFTVRHRCAPKFRAYSLTVEVGEWREELPNEKLVATGVHVDDDSWQRTMPFSFRSSPGTRGEIVIGSNGWLSLGWIFVDSWGAHRPISANWYSPVVISAFAADLRGREATRITETSGILNGSQTYTVSWYDMAAYLTNCEESTDHITGRATIVENGSIGIAFGPIIAQDVDVEIGVSGGDRTDVKSVHVTDDWLQPELSDVVRRCRLSNEHIPPPGTTYWIRPINTSVEQEHNAVTNAVPCPARTIVRLKQACSSQQLATSKVLLFTTTGSTVSVPCEQDGEDVLLTIDGLASGFYRCTINAVQYLFVVER